MTTTIDSDSSVSDATQIDDTDSPYTTQGEDEIQVDTSTASVTVTLATADLAAGRDIRIIDSGLNAGTNAITIDTGGTETINPGANSSITINIDGGYEDIFSDGGNWFTSRNRTSLDSKSVTTDQAKIGTVSGGGDTFRLIDRRTPGADTGQIQFTGLSDDREYRVFVASAFATTGTPSYFIRINGDGAATGNYVYWDASSTQQTGENEFLLHSWSNNGRFASVVHIMNGRFNNNSEIGLNHMLESANSNISDFGREGFRIISTEAISSIELIGDEDFTGGQTVAELWERDYT